MKEFFLLNILRNPWVLLLLGCLYILCGDAALASSVSSTELPYEEGLSVLYDSMTGPVAKFVAVIATAGAMLTWILVPDFGSITRLLVSVAIGVAALVGVVSLVEAFSGESALIISTHFHHSLPIVGVSRV